MSEWRLSALGILFIAFVGTSPAAGQNADPVGEKLEAIWQEGRTLVNSGKLEEALAKWQEGLRAAEEAKRDDYAGQMHVGFGIYHFNATKDLAKSEAEALLALKLNPKLVQAHALLSRIYFGAQRWDEAERESKAGLECKVWSHILEGQLIAISRQNGRPEEAAEGLQRLKDLAAEAPPDASRLGSLVFFLKIMGTPEEVVTASRRLIEVAPTVENFRSFALWYYERRDWKKSEELKREALKYNPTLTQRVEIAYELAASCVNRAAYDEALVILREAEKQAPEDPLIFAGLGSVLWKKHQLTQAETAFKKSLALKPTRVAYRNYATFCWEQQRLSEAELLARKAVEMDPKTIDDQWFYLITVLQKVGKETEALDLLARAEKIAPQNQEIFIERAGILDELGQTAEAEAAYQQALALTRNIRAMALYGMFLQTKKHDPAAAEKLMREMAEREPDNPVTLFSLGSLMQEQERWEESIEYLRKTVLLQEKAGEKFEDALRQLGRSYAMVGRSGDALELFQRLARGFAEGSNLPGQLWCLNVMAELRAEQGEFAKAITTYEEAREFMLRRFLPETRVHFTPGEKMLPSVTQFQIGRMLRLLGRQDEAIKRYKQALEEAKALPEDVRHFVLSDGSQVIPQIYAALGSTFDEKNEYRSGIDYHLRALEGSTQQEPTGFRMLVLNILLEEYRATAQFDKLAATEADYRKLITEIKDEEQRASAAARLETFLGNYDNVVDFCEKRLAAARKKQQRLPVAEALKELAHAYGHVGKHKEAFDRYEEALAIERAVPHPAGVADCQRGMASALIGQGDYVEARKWFLEALTTVQRIGQVEDIASCLVELGSLETDLGDYDAALAYYDQAQDVYKRVGNTLGEARQLHNKADLWEERKDYGKALELSQQALALKRAVGNVLATFRTLTQIGRQYMFLNQLPEAERHLEEALDLVSKARLPIGVELVQTSLAELRVKQGRAAEAEKLLLAITIADSKTGYPLDWNAWYLLGLAQKQNGNVASAITSLAQSVKIVERLREATRGSAADRLFLAKYRKVYQEITQLLLEQNQLEEAYRYIEAQKIAEIQENDPHPGFADPTKAAAYRLGRSLKFKEMELQKQIAAEVAKPASQRDEEFVTNLQSLLGQIEKQFSLYVENLPRDVRKEFIVDPLQLSAMRKSIPAGVLVVQLQVTPQGDEIGILVHSQGTSVARTRKIEGANLNHEVISYRNLLMDEHADEVEIHKLGARLYDWLLRPVESELADAKLLVISASGALRRIPFAALYDGETKQFLVEKPFPVVNLGLLKNLEPATAQRPLKIFAIANPDSADGQLALPKTEEQVAELKRLFPNTRIVAREEATLESLNWKPGADDFNVVLFATHAALDDAQPRKSYIRLARQQKLTHENIPLYTAHWPQVRLAVLSACETAARGTDATDNFALGSLAEKFDSQGIPSVLGTLWPVADSSTADLTTGFFKDMQATSTLAEALRQAQVAMLQSAKCHHPFFWAPFVLIGEWR